MTKETLDIVLAITVALVQVATFIAVIVYVRKTSQMAASTKEMVSTAEKSAAASVISSRAAEATVKELAEARDQETAPYVVVFFDLKRASPFIDLVIKNIGKTVARDVKLAFSPFIHSTVKGVNPEEMTAIKEGISSIPPGHEIRTFFDSAISRFGDDSAPLIYKVRVSYYGGLRSEERSYELTLDLKAFKGLMYGHERDLDDLVKQVEKLVNHWSRTNEKLDDLVTGIDEGLWIRNQEFIIRDLDSDENTWKTHVVAKLKEFRSFWLSNKQSKDFVPPSRIQSKCKFLGGQLLGIASNTPRGIPKEIAERCISIAANLSDLGHKPLYIGRQSVSEFEGLGNSIVKSIEEFLRFLDRGGPGPRDDT